MGWILDPTLPSLLSGCSEGWFCTAAIHYSSSLFFSFTFFIFAKSKYGKKKRKILRWEPPSYSFPLPKQGQYRLAERLAEREAKTYFHHVCPSQRLNRQQVPSMSSNGSQAMLSFWKRIFPQYSDSPNQCWPSARC